MLEIFCAMMFLVKLPRYDRSKLVELSPPIWVRGLTDTEGVTKNPEESSSTKKLFVLCAHTGAARYLHDTSLVTSRR